MSVFSDLDASRQPEAALRYLDDTDDFMSALKAYVVAAMARYVPGGRVLDLGCGVGHDLVRLAGAGLAPVGVDLSHLALRRARARATSVVRADGVRLPFRDASVDGCRIERVLQHVADPGALVDDVLRVVRPGGVLALLEPDHTSLRVDSRVDPSGALLSAMATAQHPSIGAALADQLRQRGCRVDDVVTEQSFGYQLDGLPLKAAAALDRAVSAGTLSARDGNAWLAEQAVRNRDGSFRATWTKVLVIARAPGFSGQARGVRLPAVGASAPGGRTLEA